MLYLEPSYDYDYDYDVDRRWRIGARVKYCTSDSTKPSKAIIPRDGLEKLDRILSSAHKLRGNGYKYAMDDDRAIAMFLLWIK